MSIVRETSDDEVLVHELLEDICDITWKIKRELNVINNLVKDNGELISAVAETNQTLLKKIENIDKVLSSIIEEDESENSNDDDKQK